jgi:hypothetical protein
MVEMTELDRLITLLELGGGHVPSESESVEDVAADVTWQRLQDLERKLQSHSFSSNPSAVSSLCLESFQMHESMDPAFVTGFATPASAPRTTTLDWKSLDVLLRQCGLPSIFGNDPTVALEPLPFEMPRLAALYEAMHSCLTEIRRLTAHASSLRVSAAEASQREAAALKRVTAAEQARASESRKLASLSLAAERAACRADAAEMSSHRAVEAMVDKSSCMQQNVERLRKQVLANVRKST